MTSLDGFDISITMAIRTSAGAAIRTGEPAFDSMPGMVKDFLSQDVLDVVIEGKPIRGYRSPDTRSIWIRDYSDMLRAVKYFETDVKSTVTHFAETQSRNGWIFDYFTTHPEKLPCEKENWTKYVRVPVEADVEYRFVKAAFLAWQASGDDEWIKTILPAMESALRYVLASPLRWDKNTGLVKRPYTIDTWDFAYTAGRHEWLQFQIDDHTFWGVMHGDNSGYYEAFMIMSRLYAYFNEPVLSRFWEEQATGLRTRMNRLCWNGRFYTHFKKITPVIIPEADEDRQLSLSNPMAINRGAASPDMADAMIQEYQRRREKTEAFAEWFSIDPPFPDGIFGDVKLKKGAYVNGGIMPLVGGELARAALASGWEDYGADILRRYFDLIRKTGESYLWYFPDGTPSSQETSTSPEATATDGWGSSAMLYALAEGLAGVEDRFKLFEQVKLSPRWAAAGIDEAEVRLEYAASGAAAAYAYRRTPGGIRMDVDSVHLQADFHILLPVNARASAVCVNGKKADFSISQIRESRYADFSVHGMGKVGIEIGLVRS